MSRHSIPHIRQLVSLSNIYNTRILTGNLFCLYLPSYIRFGRSHAIAVMTHPLHLRLIQFLIDFYRKNTTNYTLLSHQCFCAVIGTPVYMQGSFHKWTDIWFKFRETYRLYVKSLFKNIIKNWTFLPSKRLVLFIERAVIRDEIPYLFRLAWKKFSIEWIYLLSNHDKTLQIRTSCHKRTYNTLPTPLHTTRYYKLTSLSMRHPDGLKINPLFIRIIFCFDLS